MTSTVTRVADWQLGHLSAGAGGVQHCHHQVCGVGGVQAGGRVVWKLNFYSFDFI